MKFYTLDDSVMFVLTRVDDGGYSLPTTPHNALSSLSSSYGGRGAGLSAALASTSGSQKQRIPASSSLDALNAFGALNIGGVSTASGATAAGGFTAPALPRVDSTLKRVLVAGAASGLGGGVSAPVVGERDTTGVHTGVQGGAKVPPPHKRASSDTQAHSSL